MNKLTIEETAKVFAMYKGQKVVCYPSDDDFMTRWLSPQYLDWSVIAGTHYNVKNTRLSLFHLDKITDEHAIEVAKMCGVSDAKVVLVLGNERWVCESSRSIGTNSYYPEGHYCIISDEGIFYDDNTPYDGCSGIGNRHTDQYLISKGYAIPLWFGVDHWANNKTAIELGIAFEKI